MTKLLCFIGIEAQDGVLTVAATDNAPKYNVYYALDGGKRVQVKVLPERDLQGNPGWAVWPGTF
jgi:hypothetical protein